jgi:hypothetical protein
MLVLNRKQVQVLGLPVRVVGLFKVQGEKNVGWSVFLVKFAMNAFGNVLNTQHIAANCTTDVNSNTAVERFPNTVVFREILFATYQAQSLLFSYKLHLFLASARTFLNPFLSIVVL